MFSISLSLSFLSLYFLFPLPLGGLFEHFLEFHFDFYIVILSAFISIGCLVFILGITMYIHNLAQTQFSSVAQSRLTLCEPMDCSTPRFPVPHCFPEFAQTHVQ